MRHCRIFLAMEIDFDPDKEAINVVRHGISLLRAVELFANVVAEVVE